MRESIFVRVVANEDAMAGDSVSLERARDPEARRRILEKLLQDYKLSPVYHNQELRVEIGGAGEPGLRLGAALYQHHAPAVLGALLYFGKLWSWKTAGQGHVSLVFTPTPGTLPPEVIRLRFDEGGRLGTAFFVQCPDGAKAWEGLYGSTATQVEGRLSVVEIGVRRDSPFDTGADNGENQVDTGTAAAYCLGWLLSWAEQTLGKR